VKLGLSRNRARFFIRVKHKIAALGHPAVEVGREDDALHLIPGEAIFALAFLIRNPALGDQQPQRAEPEQFHTHGKQNEQDHNAHQRVLQNLHHGKIAIGREVSQE